MLFEVIVEYGVVLANCDHLVVGDRPVPKRYVRHRTAERADRKHTEDVLSRQPLLNQRVKFKGLSVNGREPRDASKVTVDATKLCEPFRLAVEVDKMDIQTITFERLSTGS